MMGLVASLLMICLLFYAITVKPAVNAGSFPIKTSVFLNSEVQLSKTVRFISQFLEGTNSPNNDCGPASVAMVLDAYGKKPSNETDVQFVNNVRVATNTANNSLTNWSDLETALNAYGMTDHSRISNSLTPAPDAQFNAIKQAIREDKPVIALIASFGGHWVVVTGYSDNNIYFQDPIRGTMSWTNDYFKQELLNAPPGDYGIIVGPGLSVDGGGNDGGGNDGGGNDGGGNDDGGNDGGGNDGGGNTPPPPCPSIPMLTPANGATVDSRSVNFTWQRTNDECSSRPIILKIKSISNMSGGGHDILTRKLDSQDESYGYDFEEKYEGQKIYWSVYRERSGTGPQTPRVFQIASNKPPAITLDTANDNAAASILSNRVQWMFRGTVSDPEGKLSRVTFHCEGPGYCGPGDATAQVNGNTWSYTHNALAGDVTISFVAYDDKHHTQSRKINLRIDNVPPKTTAYLRTSSAARWQYPPASGWFNQNITVRLRAVDQPAGTVLAGVGEIHYQQNGRKWNVRSGDDITFAVNSDGVHTIAYRAKDRVGNREGSRSFVLRVDKTLPTPPSGASETHGVKNNTWQKDHNMPTFTWDAPTDALSGVDRYQLYFGTNPGGSTAHRTLTMANTRTWTPQAGGVRTGTYYLRGRAKDKAGNWSAWTTLFVYRFDNTPPNNPSQVEHEEKDVFSTVWQNYTRQADFSWPLPYDAGSGVKGCYVYWGADRQGTSNEFITASFYKNATPMCEEDEVCNWYLRFRCTDKLDNIAPEWTTGFMLRYDMYPDPRSDNYRSLANAIPLGVGNLSSSGYIAHGTLGLSTPSETLSSGKYTLQTGYEPGRPIHPGTTLANHAPAGLQATTTATETCQFPTVTIDDGAVFTNKLDVTLSLCSPYAVETVVSNSPDFDGKLYDPSLQWDNYIVNATGSRTVMKPWTFASSDAISQTLTAYAAFKDWDGTVHATFFDDIIYDPDPPVGSISASDSFTETIPVVPLQANGTITVYLSVQDDVSGISKMQVNTNADLSNVSWEPFTNTIQLIPTNIYENSRKTLYARFKDVAGNVSEPVSTTFILDMQPPTGSITIDPSVVGPNVLSTTLTLESEDEHSKVAEMRISTSELFTDTIWMPYTTTHTWYVPTMENPWETLYVQYKDQAGNASDVYSDTYIIDTIPPSILYTEVVTGSAITRTIKVWAYDGIVSEANLMSLSTSPLMINDVVTIPYTDSTKWTFDKDPVVWVQVEDSVGNKSNPVPLYAEGVTITNTRNVYLPLVQR
jgi:hypothetical protein